MGWAHTAIACAGPAFPACRNVHTAVLECAWHILQGGLDAGIAVVRDQHGCLVR
jgi:hypothetical protein